MLYNFHNASAAAQHRRVLRHGKSWLLPRAECTVRQSIKWQRSDHPPCSLDKLMFNSIAAVLERERALSGLQIALDVDNS